MTRRRHPHLGSLLAGGIVIAAGFGVALVEAFKLPKGTIWVVVGSAAALILGIRLLTTRGR
jgi:hypothetical protein